MAHLRSAGSIAWVVGAVLGCGSSTPRRTTPIANEATPTQIAEPAPQLPEGCEIEESYGEDRPPVVLDGAKLEIASCKVRDVPVEEGSDMMSSDMEAYLLRDGVPHRLGSWNAGWEWGGDWAVLGTLPGGVVFLSESTYSVDEHSVTVHALQRKGERWVEVYTSQTRSQAQLEVAHDQHAATVKSCDDDDPMNSCMDDPAKVAVDQLTWDGRTLARRTP